jgi:hypothetical protein
MKAVIRIPTVQFGYIEVEVESTDGGPAGIVKIHNQFVAEYEKTKVDVQKLKDDNF